LRLSSEIFDKHSVVSQDIGMPKSPPKLDLDALLPSWELTMRAERKSASTIKNYTTGVRSFLAWCADNGHPPALDKTLAKMWIADLLDAGAEPSTATARQLGLRRFSAWLEDEGEITDDPLLGLKSPKIDKKVTDSLTDDELKRLIKACAGKDFRDRRDEAIVRLMAETGMRAGEVVALAVTDVNLDRGLATVTRGKGGKGRIAPFSPQTGLVIDRYLRARRAHRLADSPALWLGDRGKSLSYYGLHKALAGRAERAGLIGFHPHLMRHTAATRWLRAGGSEGGLMAVAGWATRDMIDRYTGASAAERAADEARGLNLGDM